MSLVEVLEEYPRGPAWTESWVEEARAALVRAQTTLWAARPYIELEAQLQNSGHGNVIGNPAKRVLMQIDELLGAGQ